jgi:methionyl-tRNA synthetase
MITSEEFEKMDLRIAEIKKVEDIEGADKLYKLTIDLGGQIKHIVAGIKQAYPKEELIEKQIVIVNNLQPIKLKGVESQGMLLAAEGPILLTTDKKARAGSKVH